jgi:hypothetical protein
VLSAYLLQAIRSDLANPGTYKISLAADTDWSDNLVLGQLSPLTAAGGGWQLSTLSFVAPADAATHQLLVFTPIAIGVGASSYPGIDLVSLTAPGAPVPLPSALYLLGPGLIGLAAIRRRFKK